MYQVKTKEPKRISLPVSMSESEYARIKRLIPHGQVSEFVRYAIHCQIELLEQEHQRGECQAVV
ncbi:MAG: hypothetical protein HC837_13555 [Chloroflexaceae bacterium]|nr:hypothetical protein [Chloroflexaceae bacterium]